MIDVAMSPELSSLPRPGKPRRPLYCSTADDWAGAVTYEPRTEAGQEYAATVGENLWPMEAIEPLVANTGLSTAAARAGNRGRRNATLAMENPRESVAAGDRIVYDESGVPMAISNDAEARTAMARLGIPPEMMNQFKYASPETRQAMMEMIRRGQARMGDSELPNARSVMGEYIGGRAQLANSALQKHGADIDAAAGSRQGTHVLTNDIAPHTTRCLRQSGLAMTVS